MYKRLVPCSELAKQALYSVNSDEDMIRLGFTCHGQLCNFEGYEEYSERLWVWIIELKDNKVNVVVTADTENCYCNVTYIDMYVKELMEEPIIVEE